MIAISFYMALVYFRHIERYWCELFLAIDYTGDLGLLCQKTWYIHGDIYHGFRCARSSTEPRSEFCCILAIAKNPAQYPLGLHRILLSPLTDFLLFDRITTINSEVVFMTCTIAIPKFKKDLLRAYMQSKYTASLRRAGAKALWIEMDDLDRAMEQILKCDGLLMPGGEDVDPAYYGQIATEKCGEIVKARDEAEMKIMKAFLPTGKPILGICRGEQLMNVYFGGSLHQDIGHIATCRHTDWRHKNLGNHKVTVKPNTKLAEIMGEETFTVNSLHHQAIDTAAPGLLVSAVSEDGIVEAVEYPEHPFCIAVQWHPEHMSAFSGVQRRIFKAFVNACR